MKKVNLNLSLKGNRNYVRGADMYKEIRRLLYQEFSLTSLSSFRLSMHKLTNRNCCLFLGKITNSFKPSQEYVANFSFNEGDCSYKGYIIEENSIIETTYPYDEEVLNELYVMDQNKIQLLLDSPYSFIDTVVAMTKYLHYRNYPSSGKWILTKLDLFHIPDENITKGMCIELTKNFNNLLTKSDIQLDHNIIGTIYFSLVVE